VQKLSEAAKKDVVVGDKVVRIYSQSFFKDDFTTWQSYSQDFRSQIAASVNGLKDFELPSGEKHRLQFIQPYEPQDVKTLLTFPGSTFFIYETLAKFSEEIIRLTGCMPRDLHDLVFYMNHCDNSIEIKDKLNRFEDKKVYELEEIAQKMVLSRT